MRINIEKRNAEAELASLREELNKVSNQISFAYLERKRIEREVAEFKDNNNLEKIISEKEKRIKELDWLYSEKLKSWQEQVESKEIKNDLLKRERKDLVSILESLNLRIMQSEICFQDLANQKEVLSKEIPLLEQREKERKKLDTEIEKLTEKRDDALVKYNDILSQSNKVIGEMQHQVLTAQNKIEDCERKAADAEIKYKMYIREHLTREKDIEIYRQRVETKIRETIPNFNLKLK